MHAFTGHVFSLQNGSTNECSTAITGYSVSSREVALEYKDHGGPEASTFLVRIPLDAKA